MSEGRLDLGIGAGWMRSDYEAAGIVLDRPGIRIDRLAETVGVLKALSGGGPVTIDGEHVHLQDLYGVPGPVQRPHLPFLIVGGGRRMLRFAGSAADIVGMNANLSGGDIGGHGARRSVDRHRTEPVDTNDIGTHVSEQHRGERPRPEAGKLDDPRAGQRAGHFGSLGSPSTRSPRMLRWISLAPP